MLVKIAPDLSEGEVDDVLGAIERAGVDGIITNDPGMLLATLHP